MRLKKQREDQAGYRRSTIALSPVAVAIAERLQQRLQLPSREAVINAVLERIDSDRVIKYEFLGSEGFRAPPTAHLQKDRVAQGADGGPASEEDPATALESHR
ncbi:hypothetical protein [Sphingomonas paucimobilis]|uniref:hypothetical protein n=1 Tax=Sphingomonas paucimobilis TaxID=13689 RepID=UPI0019D19AA7|nr:hypothetical protein [Sphingomonas paucimobilis]